MQDIFGEMLKHVDAREKLAEAARKNAEAARKNKEAMQNFKQGKYAEVDQLQAKEELITIYVIAPLFLLLN